MLACWRLTPAFCLSTRHISGFDCGAASVQSHVNGDQIQNNNVVEEEEKKRKKIVIVGMVSAKKLIWMVRKRQRQAAMGRVDRISLPRASLHDLHRFSNDN
ncbi:hypothetical protein Q3G72_028225 [Acer saccharum]|nr:hypothetical protein Q3G72_028225 [Acer saccharum]